MPRVLSGDSVRLSGQINANVESTLIFNRPISRLRMIYNSDVDLYVKFNGALTVAAGATSNTYIISDHDLYFKRTALLESLFEIDGISITRLSFFRGTQLVLPHNSLNIIGWG